MTSVKRSIVFCSTPRSGSSLTLSLVASTGKIPRGREYANVAGKGVIQRTIDRENITEFTAEEYITNPEKYFHVITDRCTNDAGDFVIKIHFRHVEQCMAKGFNILQNLVNPKFIYVDRGDLVAQSVSDRKARQMGVFTAHAEERRRANGEELPEPYYSFDEINESMDKIISEKINWEIFFAKNKIRPLRLLYESTAKDKVQAVKNIHDFLDIPFTKEDEDNVSTSFKKQANKTNDNWIEKYLDDIKS